MEKRNGWRQIDIAIISEKHAHSFQREGMSVLGTEDLQPNKQFKDVMDTHIIFFLGREKRSDDDSTPAFKPDVYLDFIEKKVKTVHGKHQVHPNQSSKVLHTFSRT